MKLLYLGNTNNKLFEYLNENTSLTSTQNKINKDFAIKFDFIVSFGYRHIIKKDVINLFQYNNIVNLHVSYLPYNRGADPNLWSILDNTQSGITIHLIDSNLDTGDILLQKKVALDFENDTLKSSYEKLQNEIIVLFIENWNLIKNNKIKPIKQNHSIKTFHCLKNRPNENIIMPQGWDTKIFDVKKLYISHIIDSQNKI